MRGEPRTSAEKPQSVDKRRRSPEGDEKGRPAPVLGRETEVRVVPRFGAAQLATAVGNREVSSKGKFSHARVEEP